MKSTSFRSATQKLTTTFGREQAPNSTVKFSKFSTPFGERYGPGGRQSVSGITATVFGSYGFIGKYVCSELGKRFYFEIFPYTR